MGAIFSAFAAFLLRGVVVKLALFLGLMFITTSFASYLVTKLSVINPEQINSGFSSITPAMWYFFEFAALDYGLPLMISALILRFSIRRIPVIG